MLVFSSVLQDEVTRMCGWRHERQPHRTRTQYGHQRRTPQQGAREPGELTAGEAELTPGCHGRAYGVILKPGRPRRHGGLAQVESGRRRSGMGRGVARADGPGWPLSMNEV